MGIVIASYLDIIYVIRNMSDSLNIVGINSLLTSGYSSQYHPTSLLIEHIKVATDHIEKLLGNLDLNFMNSLFELKQEDCYNTFINEHEFIESVNGMLSKLLCLDSTQQIESLKNVLACTLQISKLFPSFLLVNGMKLSTDHSTECKYSRNQMSIKRVTTLYRAKREYELWALCRKITYQISSSVTKVTENVGDRRRQIEDKTLRSRQRSTCKRMIETIPLINVTYLCLLIIILNYLLDFHYNTITDIDENDFSKLLKKSKKYLKICENKMSA